MMAETSALQRKLLLDTEGHQKRMAAQLDTFSGNAAVVRSREVMRRLVEWCRVQLRQMEVDDDEDEEDRAGRPTRRAALHHQRLPRPVRRLAEDQRRREEPGDAGPHLLAHLSSIFQHVVASDQVARTILKYLDVLQEQHGWPIDCSLHFICLDKAAESVAKKKSAQDGTKPVCTATTPSTD